MDHPCPDAIGGFGLVRARDPQCEGARGERITIARATQGRRADARRQLARQMRRARFVHQPGSWAVLTTALSGTGVTSQRIAWPFLILLVASGLSRQPTSRDRLQPAAFVRCLGLADRSGAGMSEQFRPLAALAPA